MICEMRSNTLIVTFTPEEMKVMNWIEDNYVGCEEEMRMYLERVIKGRQAQMNDTIKDEIHKIVLENPQINELIATKSPNAAHIRGMRKVK